MGLITEMFNSAYPNMAVTHIVREAPYKILVTSLIISAMELNYDEMVECGLYIFGFIEYPLMHHKFWEYGVKEDVMNYTIEHLPSKKFKATKVKNILELVKYDMDTAYNRSKGILVTGLDQPYLKFINTLRDQIKSTFKNIARQYYPNYENNKTQHNQGGQFDDGSLADNDGFSTNIASKIENTYTKISTSELNKKLVDITSNANKTDNSIVSGHISQIIASKNNDLYKFIETVITVYFQKNPTETSLGTATFINFGFTLYRSLSSSKNEMYLKLRLILNKWMFDIIDIKKDYQREATIISYTKSIFDYFILLINYYN